MSLAAESIADLDAELADEGQVVTVRRLASGGSPVAVQPLAFVRDYAPEELVGGVIQGDRQVVLSPTGQTGAFAAEPVRRNDELEIDGRIVNVETAIPVRVGGTIVRINLQVRG